MKIKLSQLATKLPNAQVEITNMDLSLHEATGLVNIEGTLLVGKEGVPQELLALQIPVQLTSKELLELFNVTKVTGNTRRRLK